MNVASLVSTFLDHTSERDMGTVDIGDLESTLYDMISRARAAWPTVELVDEAFVIHLAQRSVDAAFSLSSLNEIHAEDLYLACACLARDSKALSLLDIHFFPNLRHAICRIDSSSDFVDEVLQRLREKLLVPSKTSSAKLHAYSGRGPLAGWLSIVALRIALNLKQGQRYHLQLEDQLLEKGDSRPSPEQHYLNEWSADDIKTALRQAILTQTSQMRAILRLYYVDGAGLEQIARVYRVHSSTISRRMDRAREQIFSKTYRILREQHHLTRSEVDSLLEEGPNLELSLSWLLGTGSQPGDETEGKKPQR